MSPDALHMGPGPCYRASAWTRGKENRGGGALGQACPGHDALGRASCPAQGHICLLKSMTRYGIFQTRLESTWRPASIDLISAFPYVLVTAIYRKRVFSKFPKNSLWATGPPFRYLAPFHGRDSSQGARNMPDTSKIIFTSVTQKCDPVHTFRI